MPQDEDAPPLEAPAPSPEDRARPWELRLRDALVEAARRRQARRACRR